MRCVLVALSLVGILLSGCRRHESECAQVRVIDAVPDAETIQIGIPGQRASVRLRYRSATLYTSVPAGSYQLRLDAEQVDRQPYRLSAPMVMVSPRHRYSAIGMGELDSIPSASLHLFEEAPSQYPLKNNQTLVRAVNACPDAVAVDVLINNLATFKNLRYGQMSSAIALPASRYTCSAKTAGDRYTPLDLPKQIDFQGGKVCLLVVMGRVRDGSVVVEAYQD